MKEEMLIWQKREVVKNRRFQNMMWNSSSPRLLCLSLLPSQTRTLHERHDRKSVYRMSEQKKQVMMEGNWHIYHAVLAAVRKMNHKPVRDFPFFTSPTLCLSPRLYLFSSSITSTLIQRNICVIHNLFILIVYLSLGAKGFTFKSRWLHADEHTNAHLKACMTPLIHF